MGNGDSEGIDLHASGGRQPAYGPCHKHEDSATVVDITLLFENRESLQDAAHIKVSKYLPSLSTVENTMHATKREAIPMVVGARGLCLEAPSPLSRDLGECISKPECVSKE